MFEAKVMEEPFSGELSLVSFGHCIISFVGTKR